MIYAIKAAKFDDRFTNFALPDAVTILSPNIEVNAITKNVPVPGPKNPSYAPIINPIKEAYITAFLLLIFFSTSSVPNFLLKRMN